MARQRSWRHADLSRRVFMLDALYLGIIVGFLALSWGLVELCDRLQAKGTRS
jgi:hypothetical protein